MNNWTLFATLLILALGTIGYLGLQEKNAQFETQPAHAYSTLDQLGLHKHLPNRFLEQSTIMLYDKQGNIEHQLKSAKVQYYNADKPSAKVILFQPTVTIQSLKAGRLTASSARGEYTLNSGELLLQGNVLLQQNQQQGAQGYPAQDSQPFREFRTSELMINTVNKTATTDKSVQIVQPGHYIDGMGLNTNLNTGIYQLNKKIGAIHHVN